MPMSILIQDGIKEQARVGPRGNPAIRKRLFLLLQLAVTVGILAYVFRDAGQRAQMAAALRGSDLRWLAVAVVAYSGVEALGAARWCILLRIQGFSATWLSAFRQLLIAMFFNLYSPGLVGGDAIRLVYLAGERPTRKPAAVAAVLMDRMVGGISLLMIGVTAFALRYSWLTQLPAGKWLVNVTTVSLLAAALLLGIFVGGSFLETRRLRGIPLPKHVFGALKAFRKYRRHARAFWISLSLTLAAHVLYYGVFYCAARAIYQARQVIGIADIFSIMPIVNTLVCLPISFSGIGVREFVFKTLLGGLLGADSGVATLIGSTGFLVYAVWGLIGGILFVRYPPKQIQ